MAQINIVYRHSGEPKPPAGADIRRKTVKEMEDYVHGLVMEMKYAGISARFDSVEEEGKNDVVINGRSVSQILDGLDIKRPELDSDEVNPNVIKFERDPEDWNSDIIEDISDILMKNAISKAYADADSMRLNVKNDPVE